MSLPDNVASGSEWSVLPAIYDPQINLVILENASRKLDTCDELPQAIHLLQQRVHSPDIKLNAQASALPELLAKALPDTPVMQSLTQAISVLAEAFSTLFDSDSVALRFTRLEKAMCPRFHVDRIPVRLIWTLDGAGTEWLTEHNTDRIRLAQPDQDACLCPGAIQHLNTGDVALMKGEGWEGNEGRGLVHRSPAVVPGERRLILTLDLA